MLDRLCALLWTASRHATKFLLPQRLHCRRSMNSIGPQSYQMERADGRSATRAPSSMRPVALPAPVASLSWAGRCFVTPMAVTCVSRRCALPTYAFRCAQCGGFDSVRPMAEAGATAVCPSCGETARRVFVAPALRALDTGVRQALAAGEQSADSPQVVTSVPGRSRRTARITTDPRHHRLPRP